MGAGEGMGLRGSDSGSGKGRQTGWSGNRSDGVAVRERATGVPGRAWEVHASY